MAGTGRWGLPGAQLGAHALLPVRVAAAASGVGLALLAEPGWWRPAALWAAAVLVYSLLVTGRAPRRAEAAPSVRRTRLPHPHGELAADFLFAALFRWLLPQIPNGAGLFLLVAGEAAWRLGSGAAVGVGAAAAGFEAALARLHPARGGDGGVEEELFRASLLVVLAFVTGVGLERARRQLGRVRPLPEQALLAVTAAMDARDAYLARHAQPVAILAARVARAMGLGEADVQAVYYAGLLHDLGKLGVPERILSRPGPLTEEDWRVLRRYPEWGARFVESLPGLRALAEAVRHHAERWDGTGYPDGLRGEAIPLPARIIAAADVYLALTSPRPYRPALAPAEAARTLRAMAGRGLDPRVVECLLDVLCAGDETPPDPGGPDPGCDSPADAA